MNYISLQLDTNAKKLVADILEGLEENDEWFKMTARIASQIEVVLTENQYRGTVKWFSEEDYIEQLIEY